MSRMKKCDMPAKPVADAYDDLVNAVFSQAYEDLVYSIEQEARSRRKLQYGGLGIGAYRDTIQEVKRYRHDMEQLEKWFREVLPNWRDINPERIIKQAHQEVQNGLQYNHPCAQL